MKPGAVTDTQPARKKFSSMPPYVRSRALLTISDNRDKIIKYDDQKQGDEDICSF
jgi:hypothetical protein